MHVYNALHQEKITSKDQIQFVRLANVLFRKVRNDVSFIVNNRLLVLLEHQSTINENLPFRCLEYVVALYQAMVDQRLKFLPKKMELLAPEFYVIYNGDAPYPAIKEQKLSSLFKESKRLPQLELVVTVININHHDNEDFLESCPFLKGFKNLANKVKKYKGIYGKQGYIMAIEECIRENSKISDYLMRKMQEVAEMFSEEYNYLAELEASQLIGIEAGKIEGRREGRIEGRREGMMEGKIEGRMEEKLEMASTMKKKGFETAMIMELTNLSREDIERL